MVFYFMHIYLYNLMTHEQEASKSDAGLNHFLRLKYLVKPFLA